MTLLTHLTSRVRSFWSESSVTSPASDATRLTSLATPTRLVVVGLDVVGKTTLLQTISRTHAGLKETPQQIELHKPTIGFHIKILNVSGKCSRTDYSPEKWEMSLLDDHSRRPGCDSASELKWASGYPDESRRRLLVSMLSSVGLASASDEKALFTHSISQQPRSASSSSSSSSRSRKRDDTKISLTAYCLGGGRPPFFFHLEALLARLAGHDGIMFVVDATDPERICEAREELSRLLANPGLASIPLLVLANHWSAGHEEKVVRKPRWPGDQFITMDMDDIMIKMAITEHAKNRLTALYLVNVKTGEGLSQALAWLVQTISERRKLTSSKCIS